MEANIVLDGFVMRNRFSDPTIALPTRVLDQSASRTMCLLNSHINASPATISFNIFPADKPTGSQGGLQVQAISNRDVAADTK